MTEAIPILVAASRCLSGSILVIAGVLKWYWPREFSRSVEQFRIMPKRLVPVVAHLLPSVEIIVGASVLASVVVVFPNSQWASLVAAVAYLIFTTAVLVAIARKTQDLSCGCFGVASESIGRLTVARNLILLSLSIVGGISTDNEVAADQSIPLIVSAVGIALTGALLWNAVVATSRLLSREPESNTVSPAALGERSL